MRMRNCFVSPTSVSWFMLTPGGLFSVSESTPCFIANYELEVEVEIAEKIFRRFAKEKDVFLNIIDNQDGMSELDLYFVIQCSPPAELESESFGRIAVFGSPAGMTREVLGPIQRGIIAEHKLVVDRFVSGMELELPTATLSPLLQARDRVGHFLVGIGVEASSGGSYVYNHWCVRKSEVFSSKDLFRFVVQDRVGGLKYQRV